MKRKSFEHDRELRAILWDTNLMWEIELGTNEAPRRGEYVQIDVNALVDEIRVAPGAPQWFVELTDSVCKKYGLEKEIKQSGLDESPLF
jgi:hypothetical protein